MPDCFCAKDAKLRNAPPRDSDLGVLGERPRLGERICSDARISRTKRAIHVGANERRGSDPLRAIATTSLTSLHPNVSP